MADRTDEQMGAAAKRASELGRRVLAPSRVAPARLEKGLFLLGLVLGLAILAASWMVSLKSYTIWDDAYMFVRYADNILAEGRLAWNPGGPQTYGPTSPLYLLVVVPFRALLRDNPLAAALLSSLVCGVLFLGLLLRLLHTLAAGRARLARLLMLGGVLLVLGATDDLNVHFLNGMDTTFALLYLTLYLSGWIWHDRAGSLVSAGLVGLLGGLAFWVRPDLCLYVTVTPAVVLLLDRSPERWRRTGLLLATTLAATGALILVSWQILGSPLPLAFYCKSLTWYGESIREMYSRVGLRQLVLYAAAFWFLLLPVVWSLVLDARAWIAREAVFGLGLLVATALFLLFYAGFALQIMYYHARFYYPTLPALLVVAVQAWTMIARSLEARGLSLARVKPRAWTYLLLVMCVSMAWPAARTYAAVLELERKGRKRIEKISTKVSWKEIRDNAKRALHHNWFQLGPISSLPDDLVLATTEVGHVAAMNPRKTVVDMAGLNETEFAHDGFSAERLFAVYGPDFIYLPYHNYVQMTREIEEHETFRRHYVYIRRRQIQRNFGVAFRKDSRYAYRMAAVVARGLKPGDGRALVKQWASPLAERKRALRLIEALAAREGLRIPPKAPLFRIGQGYAVRVEGPQGGHQLLIANLKLDRAFAVRSGFRRAYERWAPRRISPRRRMRSCELLGRPIDSERPRGGGAIQRFERGHLIAAPTKRGAVTLHLAR